MHLTRQDRQTTEVDVHINEVSARFSSFCLAVAHP